MALPPFVDGMRSTRRRQPFVRPHARTLLHTRERSWRVSSRWIGRGLVILLVLLAGAIYALLFWSPQFRVEQPQISGNQRISTAALSEAVAPLLRGQRWLIAPANALLAAPTEEIKATVTSAFPDVASVTVHKELPNVLKITVSEREPLAIWSAAGQFFFVDERGIAFDQIIRSESRDVSLPVVVDEHNRATLEGDRVMTEATLHFVRDTYAGITRQAGVGINFFVAPSRLAPDLTLVTSEGWRILFDTNQPATVQIATLSEVLKSQVPDRGQLQYIDLRIAGRVFVK
ncbi:MAG: FtsQ-type POTRA domain-containing protein [Candidatus Andersenbacteria bacterium]